MPASCPSTEKALTGSYAALALVLLLRVSSLHAEPAASSPPVSWDLRPLEGHGGKADLPSALPGEARQSGADAPDGDFSAGGAPPAARGSDEASVRPPKKTSASAFSEPRAVSTGANLSPQLGQAMLDGVRVRLRNLGLLGLTDVSDSALAEAVRQFQVSNKIPETGVLDRDTLGRLLVP
jgi:hypothetical protein